MLNYIQIGTNVGNDYFFEEIVKKSPLNSNIYLIEANKNLLEAIKTNYKDITDRFIDITNVAITPFPEKQVDLYLYSFDSHSSLLDRRTHASVNKTTVPATTLEDFFQEKQIKHVEVLYIDAEGLDVSILLSLDLKKYNIKNIFFEEWPYSQDDLNQKYLTSRDATLQLKKTYKDFYDFEQIVIEGMLNTKMTLKAI